MKRMTTLTCLLLALTLSAGVSHASAVNVALGKDVTLLAGGGASFFTGGWGAGQTVPGSTVTDGLFLPRSSQWDQGAVWWDATNAQQGQQGILINLGGTFTLESLIVQADDNDGYLLYYGSGGLDAAGTLLWDIPAVGGWGMQTRPDPSDDTRRLVLPTPVVAEWLLICGNNAVGDRLFSVSEVQAYGTSAVPEPGSMVLLGIGLAGLAFRGRLRNR
jgi:hypothetical protein